MKKICDFTHTTGSDFLTSKNHLYYLLLPFFIFWENILLIEFKIILQIYENIRCLLIYENTNTIEFSKIHVLVHIRYTKFMPRPQPYFGYFKVKY